MKELFEQQAERLKEAQFYILYWAAKAEELSRKYNITNVFDDLKFIASTRTKQSAVSYVESLSSLCFLNISGESNSKNIYITKYGAQALEYLLSVKHFQIKKSYFLEVMK